MRTLEGIRWDLLAFPLVVFGVFSCSESAEDRGIVSAPDTEMGLTALAICEDWKPNDPKWVEFCEEIRQQAMLQLEHEDPLCAQYAQQVLDNDQRDRIRWVSGSPPTSQRVCYINCLGEDCTLYCYDAAAHDMPSDRVPWLVEHEGCHFNDAMSCTDREIRNSDNTYSPAIGSGAYEANRCMGENLEPW